MTNWVEATYSCADEAPEFLEHELNRLYGTRYSCLPYFKLYGSWDRVRAYVARQAGEVVAVFLFRCEKGRAIVLNEGMNVSEEDVNRFASYLFRNHDGLSLIAFHYIETAARRFAFPFQRAACGQDTVLELPASVDAYTASLGSSTRLTLHHAVDRLRHELASLTFSVQEKQDVPVRSIRDIIALHRARSGGANQAAQIDADEEDRIIAYVALCGFVTTVTSNGQVCAGAITYRLGSNFTTRVLAHDPAYGGHRLGLVCAYLTVCACIKTGNSRYFNFGWGQKEYMRQLGGRDRQLVRLALFRSRLHVLRYAGLALGAMLGGCAFHARRWLVHTSRRKGVRARLADALIGAGRWLRSWSQI